MCYNWLVVDNQRNRGLYLIYWLSVQDFFSLKYVSCVLKFVGYKVNIWLKAACAFQALDDM